MKEFRYQINFESQAFLSIGLNFSNLSDVQKMTLEQLERQGWCCIRTRDTQVEDLPLLYHCMQQTAAQLGIQANPRIGVLLQPCEVSNVFYQCVSEIWPPKNILDPVIIPYSLENIEVLLAIVDRLTTLRSVVVYDNFEDTVRELVPEPCLTHECFASDLDAVVFLNTVALRWQNVEVSGSVSQACQALKVLDEMALEEPSTDQFVRVLLSTGNAKPSAYTFPLRGDCKELTKSVGRAKVVFHDWFPPLAAQKIMYFVGVLIDEAARRRKRCRRGVVVNVGLGDDQLQVEPPDTVWIPRNRLYGYTSLPTQALAAVHLVQLLESRRRSERR
jgi:hypothetical protein